MLAEAARRLRVDEVSLRISIDAVSPYPTLDVLTAVVKHFGIDPTFIVTGRYDGVSHRRTLDDPAGAAETLRDLTLLRREGPIAEPTEEPPSFHIA